MQQHDAKAIQTVHYGDVFRWWIGSVISINDPLRLGRVRVRIYGVHSDNLLDVPENALPWASCIIPTTEDGVSGQGRSTGLKEGAQVVGFFADGPQSQIPVVFGSIPRIEGPTPTQTGLGSEYATAVFSSTPWSAGGVTDRSSVNGAGGAMGGRVYNNGTAVGSSNTEKAWNFLTATGQFSPLQVAAIIGNFIQESGMEPGTVSSFSGEDSFGIAQWNPAAGRLQELQAWCAENRQDHTTLEGQLQFFMYDFLEKSPRFYRAAEFRATTSMPTAVRLFMENYERPGVPHYEGRLQYARDAYEQYVYSTEESRSSDETVANTGENGRLDGSTLASIGGSYALRRDAANAWLRMARAAAADGITLNVTSAYRDYETQYRLWAASDRTGRYVASPGGSNHGWGIAVDEGSIYAFMHQYPRAQRTNAVAANNATYRWLNANAGRFNFYQRMDWEAWHWEYTINNPLRSRVA